MEHKFKIGDRIKCDSLWIEGTVIKVGLDQVCMVQWDENDLGMKKEIVNLASDESISRIPLPFGYDDFKERIQERMF